jgi:hypothetical protein
MQIPNLQGLPLKPIALVLALVVVYAVSSLVGLSAALLVLGFMSLFLAIACLWNSVQSLTGDAPMTLEEALTLGTPSSEQERKRAVLRALKDLDFERSVGKISEEDYATLSHRYRQEAKTLLQTLDATASAQHEQIDALVQRRMVDGPVPRKKKKKKASVAPPPADATPAEGEERELPGRDAEADAQAPTVAADAAAREES